MLTRRPLTICAAGFSLVEMVLVVAIIGVGAAMVIPRFSNSTERWRAETASRKLIADINWVRQAARTRGQTASIDFTTGSTTYTLSGGVSVSGSALPNLSINLGTAPFSCSRLSTSLVVAGTTTATTTLSFDAAGLPLAEGSIVVGTAGSSRTITISAPGGAITVQ